MALVDLRLPTKEAKQISKCLMTHPPTNTEKAMNNKDQGAATPDNKWPEQLIDIADCMHRKLVEKGYDESDADELSTDLTAALADEMGGIQFYLPKGQRLSRAIRDRRIYLEHSRGNTAELAKKYGLNEIRIYDIVKEQRALHIREVQPELFPQ